MPLQVEDPAVNDVIPPVRELADEAFADLLKKHHRPVTLKEALSESAGEQPRQQHRKARKKNARASRT
jgi:hypothetical protein